MPKEQTGGLEVPEAYSSDSDPNPSYDGILEAVPTATLRGQFKIMHKRTSQPLNGSGTIWPARGKLVLRLAQMARPFWMH